MIREEEPDMARRRRKLHEVVIHEDIRFRGPLNSLHFQILGWLCIVLSVVSFEIGLGARINEGLANRAESLLPTLAIITDMSLPFLLISNFSKILNNDEGYGKQLLRNGAAALGIFAASAFFFSRYVIGSVGKLVVDPEDVLPGLTELFRAYNKAGFISLNIFVDLFLCTLFMFFLNARPKRVFTGKKVWILRALSLLPLACEAGSWILKWKSANGSITLPFWSFQLLTVKPPLTFAVFVLLALWIKTRELRFCRHGRTHEEYLAFLKTNRNSLHFSVFLAVILAAAALVDLVLLMVVMRQQAGSLEALSTVAETDVDRLMEFTRPGQAVGIGGAFSLIFVAPLVLLYNYTRVPKNKIIGMLVPAAGILLIILALLEGFHQGLGYLPFERWDFREIIRVLSSE